MSAAQPLVLITRSEPGASRTAARAQALGYAPLVAPVAVREPLMTPEALGAALKTAPAIALTSAHAARALYATAIGRNVAIFAVGEATGEAAREAGFTKVTSASGDVAALARVIVKSGVSGVAHVRGEDAAGDLSGALAGAGVACVEAVVYRMSPVAELSRAATRALGAGDLAAVMIHSAAGARRWIALADAAGLRDAARATPSAAISEAAATPLRQAGVRSLAIAPSPDEAALLEALAQVAPLR